MSFSPLDQFFDRLLDSAWYPTVRYQSLNPSPCTFGPIDSECQVRWRPIPRTQAAEAESRTLLEGVERLPRSTRDTLTQAVQFVTSYWSAPLDCRFGYDRIVLDCGVWNEADLNRKSVALKENIDTTIRQKSSIVPIAWPGADSGFYIGLNSQTGEVVMTEIGVVESGERLAASLADFLHGLRPVKGYFSETVQSF